VKTGEIGSDRLSKSASWLWLAFKIGELALAGFQNWQVGSGRLSKSASWLWPAFKSSWRRSEKSVIWSKGFELAGFQKLFANSKTVCAKRQSIN
jgi:hypothetical protein